MDRVSVAPIGDTVRALDRAANRQEVQRILRTNARALTRAHGATVVFLDGDQCYYADEDAMSPLWKGQRFPVASCISGWAMLHRTNVVIPDIRVDSRIPQAAYRPTFVRSLAVVPIRVEDPLGAIGAYWASRHVASTEEVAALRYLADAAGAALGRLELELA